MKLVENQPFYYRAVKFAADKTVVILQKTDKSGRIHVLTDGDELLIKMLRADEINSMMTELDEVLGERGGLTADEVAVDGRANDQVVALAEVEAPAFIDVSPAGTSVTVLSHEAAQAIGKLIERGINSTHSRLVMQ